MISEFIQKFKSAKSHVAKQIILIDMIKEIFGIELENLLSGVEKRLESKILGLSGRTDLLFSNVIFEVKMDLTKEQKNAEDQLKKYIEILKEKNPDAEYIGIATDGLKFKAYRFHNGELKEISSIDISKVSERDAILWLDSFIFSKPKITPTAEDLKYRFGSGSPTYAIFIDELKELWKDVKNLEDVKLKFELWLKNMEIVYGSKPTLDTFLDHTYLVTLIKLIIYLKLSEDEILEKENVKKAISGEYFASFGITNLIEEDYFSWILNPKIIDRSLELIYKLGKELMKYDFSKINEDFFKEIYEEIVERGQRHRIGEYYTPEWLVELIFKKVLDFIGNKKIRILDPACGSGTFLCSVIRILKNKLDLEAEELLDYILNSIVGLDVNPLAVIIARANYLLALDELLYLGKRITIPIYVADAIKLPEKTFSIEEGIMVINYKIDSETLSLPYNVAKDSEKLNLVIDRLKEVIKSYIAEKDVEKAVRMFKKNLNFTENEINVLIDTLEKILKMVDEGKDSIWVFVLGNIYRPISLSEAKFDLIIGNPPWISMRYIENKEYQDFVKDEVFRYGLLGTGETHLFTHMEMATLFFCKSADLYLQDGGIIAFVMPRSVLTGALHHARFKKFENSPIKLLEILDLEGVSPLFNVPSCVLIGIKGQKTEYPVKALKITGKLPKKNAKLHEVEAILKMDEYEYKPPKVSYGRSYYYDLFKNGINIYPRCFWFIEFKPHRTLGLDVSKPYVKTLKGKKPWDLELKGNVESEFIYATILGEDLVPFGFNLRPIVLPIIVDKGRYRLLDVDDLEKLGFVNMAEWLKQAQKLWEERATERSLISYPRVISWVNYNNKLQYQNPLKRFVVIYNAGGKNIASCVVDKQNLPEFRVLKAKIKPKGFIADIKTWFYETNSEDEAHYLCVILNSDVINELIKPIQTKGSFGERDIHRRPLMFPIPQFDENDEKHLRLAELSKICHEKISKIQFKSKSIGKRREEARKAVKEELKEINEIINELPI